MRGRPKALVHETEIKPITFQNKKIVSVLSTFQNGHHYCEKLCSSVYKTEWNNNISFDYTK